MVIDRNLHGPSRRTWRLVSWTGAALVLLAPAVAMQLTDEVNWGWEDFAAMAALLLIACAAWEGALRVTSRLGPRLLSAGAILIALILVWLQLAVGLW